MSETTTVHDAMYRQVGGDAGMTVLVDDFYARLWSDPASTGTSPGSTGRR